MYPPGRGVRGAPSLPPAMRCYGTRGSSCRGSILPRVQPGESPARGVLGRQVLAGQRGSDHLDGDRILLEDGVVERAIGHLARLDQLAMERPELHAAEEIGRLVERAV